MGPVRKGVEQVTFSTGTWAGELEAITRLEEIFDRSVKLVALFD